MLRGAALFALGAIVAVLAVNMNSSVPEAEAAAPVVQQEANPEYLNPSSRIPFSEAVRYNGTLYLSGKLGLGGERGIVPETRAALESIQAAVERHGSSMDRVMKCLVMLADIEDYGAMNQVYAEFFPENKPARSALAVGGLVSDAKIEIECLAAA